jgi:hypothetical protein
MIYNISLNYDARFQFQILLPDEGIFEFFEVVLKKFVQNTGQHFLNCNLCVDNEPRRSLLQIYQDGGFYISIYKGYEQIKAVKGDFPPREFEKIKFLFA